MKQLFDCIDLKEGGKGVIVHIYEGVMPPTYLVELFHMPSDNPVDRVVTLQEQPDGILRRLSPSLKDFPDASDQKNRVAAPLEWYANPPSQ